MIELALGIIAVVIVVRVVLFVLLTIVVVTGTIIDRIFN